VKPITREWLQIAAEDLDTAVAMCDAGRYLYAGFEAQQAAEKALKAVIQETVRVPPKVHNLVLLAHRAMLCEKDLVTRLAELTPYAVATRYPEERRLLGQRTTPDVARRLIETARDVLAWAKRQLTSEES
jgi:HEPN domain-containing protein